MSICKGFNRDGSKCNRKIDRRSALNGVKNDEAPSASGVTRGDECCANDLMKNASFEYCWQHCEQYLDQGGPVIAPKKVFKMPVEISIDNYQVEIDSLKADIDFMTKKFEESTEPESLEEMSEFAHKTFRMQELCKAVSQLEIKKKENFKEEKQFRVLVHNVPKSQTFQAPQSDRLVQSPGFKRAIDFEIKKLNSRQRKLDNKKKAIKDVKTVKNVEDE